MDLSGSGQRQQADRVMVGRRSRLANRVQLTISGARRARSDRSVLRDLRALDAEAGGGVRSVPRERGRAGGVPDDAPGGRVRTARRKGETITWKISGVG